MNFARIAMEEAKRLLKESHKEDRWNPIKEDLSSYIKKRRERSFRRLSEFVKDLNGLTLITNRPLTVENSGSAVMFPCIRLSEVMKFENKPIADIFIEITDEGKVQCRAECLWFDPTVRLTSEYPERLMTRLAKQIGSILKVEE
jgi:hypothetical protein